MSRPADADFELLGVPPSVEEADLHRAYHRRGGNFKPPSPPTYSLTDGRGREGAPG